MPARDLHREQRDPSAPGGVVAPGALNVPFTVETFGAAEQRLSFRVGDSWCRLNNLSLRSGVRLGLTACQYEPSFSLSVVQPPSELEVLIAKGPAILARSLNGDDFQIGGNTLQLAQTRRPLPLQIRPGGEAPTECVSVALSESWLREILGVATLPQAFREVTESEAVRPLATHALTPRLLRLLDELLGTEVKGASRLLWYEAKALELVAQVTDELADAAAVRLSVRDVERMERARRCLVEHLETPPTLRELARDAGCSETKLKGAFRTAFGTSVFAYLRQARLEEARRLLLQRRWSIAEVSLRVGYTNPSKFAAAFRKHFGTSPSDI